jgi:hypothetical protein
MPLQIASRQSIILSNCMPQRLTICEFAAGDRQHDRQMGRSELIDRVRCPKITAKLIGLQATSAGSRRLPQNHERRMNSAQASPVAVVQRLGDDYLRGLFNRKIG